MIYIAGSISGTSIANSTIPKGLQMIVQDSTAQVTCTMPLGSAYSINNKLVQSISLFQNSPSNPRHQDCQTALQKAHAIGLQSLWANISFCIDDVQLLSSTLPSQGMTDFSCPPGPVYNLSLQQDALLQVYITVRTALGAGRPRLPHVLVPEALQLIFIPSWLYCCCVILHILSLGCRLGRLPL